MSVTNRRSVLQGAAVVSGAIFGTSSRVNATIAADTQKVGNDMTADEIRSLLKLEPNATCGFVRETYRAALAITPGGLPAPFADGRPLGSALYFMVTPAAPVKLHRIRNDQLYHYYLGDPLEVLLLRGKGERIIVGPDLRAGHSVQLFIPGNTFHTARIIGAKRWFLGASTEWPGVVPSDVEIGNADLLTPEFPEVAADVRNFPEPAN
jgi:predicted cupin superfamily sugar epimerase